MRDDEIHNYENEKERQAIYMDDVYRLRDMLRIGDIVKAEVYHANTIDRENKQTDFGTEPVEIIDKYTHFAITDKGVIDWKNIAIHNKDLVRRTRC